MGRPRSWTCARCGVTASYPGQRAPEQPAGWVEEGGGWHCLRCRRENAMDRASAGTNAEGKSQRRRALMEFELLRDPGASDRVIAKRARCSTSYIRPVRAALRKSGKLPPVAG